MTESIRKLVRFSTDAAALAREVGELARDVYQRTRYTQSVKEWGPGTVTFGTTFRIDVGRFKPVAIQCVDVEDDTNRTKQVPPGVQWQWVDGAAQIDAMDPTLSASTVYRLRFLVTHDRGSAQ